MGRACTETKDAMAEKEPPPDAPLARRTILKGASRAKIRSGARNKAIHEACLLRFRPINASAAGSLAGVRGGPRRSTYRRNSRRSSPRPQPAPVRSRLIRLREKLTQLAVGFLRRFVGQVVPAGQRLAGANVQCVARPDLHRLVVAADAASRAP